MIALFYSLAILAFVIFIFIWGSLDTQFIASIDKWGTETFGGNDTLELFHYLGETLFVVAVGVALVIYFYMKKRFRKLSFVLLTFVGGTIVNQAIKFIVERPRPEIPDQLTSYSFPSGHSMMSMLYLMTTAYLLSENCKPIVKKIAITIALVLIALIGLSRVAGSRHFMSDVFGGWSLGFAFFMLIVYWYRRGLNHREMMPKKENR